MVTLELSWNDEIDDEGWAMLLECLSNVEKLYLYDCDISPEMEDKLRERGRKVRCDVHVQYSYRSQLDNFLE